jgi:hypothetical protein
MMPLKETANCSTTVDAVVMKTDSRQSKNAEKFAKLIECEFWER